MELGVGGRIESAWGVGPGSGFHHQSLCPASGWPAPSRSPIVGARKGTFVPSQDSVGSHFAITAPTEAGNLKTGL